VRRALATDGKVQDAWTFLLMRLTAFGAARAATSAKGLSSSPTKTSATGDESVAKI
jgi:hypothetical protein